MCYYLSNILILTFLHSENQSQNCRFDPYSLLFAFKNKAVNLGVNYVSGEVTNFLFPKNDLNIEKDSCQQINGAIVSKQ